MWQTVHSDLDPLLPVAALAFRMSHYHWATSLFGLVFRSVISLSPKTKTNLTPEFWSQSEVRISLAETGARIATKIPMLLIFVLLARYSFKYSLFAVLRFTKHCAKRVLRKK